nr:hypothetical protein [Tanacetum cinerariifolium]
MSKNDMKNHVSTLSKSDLEDLIKAFHIPLDLHPRLPDSTFTMDRLPSDAIGVYSEFLWFSSVQVSFLTFLLFVLKYFKTHSYSCVSDDLPADGYNQSDVEQLRAHLICLHEMKEEMSIYDLMTLPSWDDAKIVKEPHHLFEPLLKRVSSHTTVPAAEGALIPFPTPYEVVAAQPELEQAEGLNEANITDFCVKLEDSKERDEGTSIMAALVPTSSIGKRLGPPPLVTVTSDLDQPMLELQLMLLPLAVALLLESEAEDIGRQMDPLDALACNALSRDVEYDEIPKDDFGTATRELSNRVNVLSALLVSHGYELNSRYTNLVASKENRDLRSQRDVASEEALIVRDLQNELASKRLLSSDEFHDALAQVASLGINYGVERGLRMGRTDADFEVVAQKVFNFHIDAEADFNKALVAFPTTPFLFLARLLWQLEIVLLVGMPIFAGMTAPVPYAMLNDVSPLLVLGIVLWAHNTFDNSFTHAPPTWCSLVLIPCIML